MMLWADSSICQLRELSTTTQVTFSCSAPIRPSPGKWEHRRYARSSPTGEHVLLGTGVSRAREPAERPSSPI